MYLDLYMILLLQLLIGMPWKDYSIGDLVKYKQFYYTASKKIVGAEKFQSDEWLPLK